MKLSRLGAFSIAVLGISTLAGGFFGNRVLAGGNKLSDHLRLYTAILSAVEEHYAEPVKSDKLVSSSIREMLRTLDPHSNFLETKEYSTLQERQKGSYYGLGITVQSIDGNINVVSPFEGTPAHRLGIRARDVISKIEKELEKALRTLTQQGAASLILDIRDNPGGLLDQAFAVSNLFLKKGQMVVFTRGRTKRDETSYVTEEESRFASLPLIVLTSKHSASASEIVAGAIQDHDRGLIVGETTFGKGLVQTIMPLRNVRGYALALTTARYYTPSGRSIQRDYGSTAFEDYVAPKDRKTCDEARSGQAKLTDARRKAFGGDGITPDFCVEQETPNKFVAYLISKAAFGGVARSFSAAETTGSAADIAGAGKRSEGNAAKLRIVGRDFPVENRAIAQFKSYLDTPKVKDTTQAHAANPNVIAHQITEQVLLQVFGEGETRRRSMAWDPQVKKALELVPKSDLLLKDPQRFIAERVAENRPVAPAPARYVGLLA